jgi:hypothetical protein
MPERAWKQLHAYWLSKHVGGRPPARADLDPIIEIPRLVKNLMLLDVKDGFTFRLVGSEVVQRHGIDMTGRRAGSGGQNTKAYIEWRAAVDYVTSMVKPRLLVSRIGTAEIAQNVMLLLPLTDQEGRIEMLLIGSFYNEHFQPGTDIADMDAREVPAD